MESEGGKASTRFLATGAKPQTKRKGSAYCQPLGTPLGGGVGGGKLGTVHATLSDGQTG